MCCRLSACVVFGKTPRPLPNYPLRRAATRESQGLCHFSFIQVHMFWGDRVWHMFGGQCKGPWLGLDRIVGGYEVAAYVSPVE